MRRKDALRPEEAQYIAELLQIPVELVEDLSRDYRMPLFIFRNADGCHWAQPKGEIDGQY